MQCRQDALLCNRCRINYASVTYEAIDPSIYIFLLSEYNSCNITHALLYITIYKHTYIHTGLYINIVYYRLK